MKEKLFPLMSMLLLVGLLGCSGVKNSMRLSEKNSAWNPLHKLSQERKDKQEEGAVPVTMAAIWTDSVYEQLGQPTVKGFGGRIFFYDENSTAVKADGELVIYGFDDSVKDKTESKADRKFVFKAEDFQKHYSENDLGGAYSVWVPWEPVGGYRKTITLIPMFRTADGRLIKCSQSISTLPGKLKKDDLADESSPKQSYEVLGSSPSVVSQANYQSGTAIAGSNQGNASAGFQTQSESTPRIKSSTIKMTPSMSRRMAQVNSMRNLQKIQATKNPALFANDSKFANSNQITAADSALDRKSPPASKKLNTKAPATNVETRAFGQPGSWN